MLFLTAATVRLITFVLINELTSLTLALPRARATGEVTAKSGMSPEPTCEELKAMWRFSKRQSRAAEITNEIPMYRDPFVDNVWEPYYATSRSIGGQRIGRFKTRPIYGHVVHKPPYMRIQDSAARQKAFEEVVRLYALPPQTEPRRKITTFRLPGGRHLSSLGFPPQQGSFQHLKELIKTERARELQQQRASEESAARAAALRDLSDDNRRNHGGYYDHYDYGSIDDDDLAINTMNAGNKQRNGGVIAFPDLLAPAANRPNPNLARFGPEFGYSRNAPRTRTRPTLLDDSFNTGYSGYLP